MDSLEGIDSRFRYAILAAKRAKQLVGGSRKKVDIISENPLTIALEEIRQGKINFHILEEEEVARELPIAEPETHEENNEENEIDRDLFFRPNVNRNFEDDDEEEEEEEEEDEDEDDVEDEDEDNDDEDEDDEDSDDYGDDYDDDDDEEGIIYNEDEEDDD